MLGSLLLALLSTLPGGMDAAAGDARLNDLCFVDAEHGWAVGDRGVIWHTDDGGRHWQQQTSGVDCNLQGVCFLNAQLGWAVGGFTHPYTHTSNGVVLATADGGQTWKHNPKLLLPGLAADRFLQSAARLGHCLPLGLVSRRRVRQRRRRTKLAAAARRRCRLDGGRLSRSARMDWWPAATVRWPSFAAASWNRFGADGVELRSFARARLLSPTIGWLVGEGGLVQNIGLSGAASQPSPNLPKAARHFDFAALAVRGPKCWIAGSPGTRVFYTADAGRTWSMFDTGTTLPLRAMTFVDDQHGWAAGELGTILATSDGGRTWQSQRAGGSRAALLAIVADPDDVPLELLARVSGNEGCLSVVELLGRRDVEIPLPRRCSPARPAARGGGSRGRMRGRAGVAVPLCAGRACG